MGSVHAYFTEFAALHMCLDNTERTHATTGRDSRVTTQVTTQRGALVFIPRPTSPGTPDPARRRNVPQPGPIVISP